MDCVRYDTDDNIAYLSISRPLAGNKVDETVARLLLDGLQQADEDSDIAVLVIGGRGAFCGGLDPEVLLHVGDGRRWSSIASLLDTAFYPIVSRLRALSKPSLAVIDGPAAGFGMSLALSCDFRLGTDDAVFVPTSLPLGLVPDCGALWHLVRLVGYGRAMEIAAFSAPIGAAEAKEIGLITWHAETGDLAADAAMWARRLAEVSGIALLETRDLLGEAHRLTLTQALESERATISILGETVDHVRKRERLREATLMRSGAVGASADVAGPLPIDRRRGPASHQG